MANKKFDFISGLDEPPKAKYQLFEAELGIERASVLIPFEEAEKFEEEALKKKPKSKSALTKLAEKYGGMVE